MRPLLCLTVILAVAGGAAGQVSQRQPAQTLSDAAAPSAAGLSLLHLLSADPERRETGRRLSDAVIITGLLTYGLKETVHSARPAPGESESDGFPSGHTALAFATAAALATRESRAAWVAYPLAAAVGWSRHDLQRHTWAQVIGGALLGAYLGRQAGQGKLTLFGHSDSEAAPRAAAVGSPHQVVVWGTSF